MVIPRDLKVMTAAIRDLGHPMCCAAVNGITIHSGIETWTAAVLEGIQPLFPSPRLSIAFAWKGKREHECLDHRRHSGTIIISTPRHGDYRRGQPSYGTGVTVDLAARKRKPRPEDESVMMGDSL